MTRRRPNPLLVRKCPVTVSKHSSTPKKTVSRSTEKSHHETAAPAALNAESVATPAPVNSPPQDPAPAKSLSAIASESIAQLQALEAKLNLDIAIPPNDKAQVRALARVSDTAIGLASEVVSAAPSRFPDFATLPAAAAYVATMQPLADQAGALATHVQKSVQNQRTPAALQALALYAVVKGLGRLNGNETMREKVTALKAEIAPKRAKPKETKGVKGAKRLAKAQADRLQKAQAIVASGGARPGSPIPIPSAGPAVAVGAVVQPAPVAPAVAPAAPSATNGAASTAAPPAAH
jgi:hypothetical protein